MSLFIRAVYNHWTGLLDQRAHDMCSSFLSNLSTWYARHLWSYLALWDWSHLKRVLLAGSGCPSSSPSHLERLIDWFMCRFELRSIYTRKSLLPYLCTINLFYPPPSQIATAISDMWGPWAVWWLDDVLLEHVLQSFLSSCTVVLGVQVVHPLYEYNVVLCQCILDLLSHLQRHQRRSIAVRTVGRFPRLIAFPLHFSPFAIAGLASWV